LIYIDDVTNYVTGRSTTSLHAETSIGAVIDNSTKRIYVTHECIVWYWYVNPLKPTGTIQVQL